MSKQLADRKSANDKQSLVSIEDSSRHERKNNTRVAFKSKSKEAIVHFDKKENDSAGIQEEFQT